MNICQSYGMEMVESNLFGKNKDDTLNSEYCKHCFPNGEFNKPDETFEEMVESCVPFMMKEGYTEVQAREYLVKNLKSLKRWTKE